MLNLGLKWYQIEILKKNNAVNRCGGKPVLSDFDQPWLCPWLYNNSGLNSWFNTINSNNVYKRMLLPSFNPLSRWLCKHDIVTWALPKPSPKCIFIFLSSSGYTLLKLHSRIHRQKQTSHTFLPARYRKFGCRRAIAASLNVWRAPKLLH